ncbi:MAG: 1-(5-phosphoribosyl)-5-[(5-phosphoribosylamino)methylideneamino]imidazole-4-carboxamide isomerase [Alphaproteobacteria bacterium]|tara:strand:+ start:2960 stop:3685 length:726 start_codon:yes stop_codon:yes gene_type:complete
MNFYPAIDIKDGKFIRLKQGRLDEVTVYGDNPVEIAKKFSRAGAKWIHVVDIDGAFKGKSINQKVILDIKKNSKTKIQVGGGIRTQESASFYLNNGIDRVVLGTIALENPKIIEQLCENYPGRIAVGIDAKKGMVATEGWSKTSTIEVGKLSKLYENIGVSCVIFTDIEKDGLMEGVSLNQLKNLLKNTKLNVIASGGVSSLDDLKKIKSLKKKNLIGVISGKAIYENKFSVNKAVEILES